MLAVDKRTIDEILLEEVRIKFEQVKKAWDIQRETQKNIQEILVENGVITQKDILFAKACQLGVGFLDIGVYELRDEKIPLLISEGLACFSSVLPT